MAERTGLNAGESVLPAAVCASRSVEETRGPEMGELSPLPSMYDLVSDHPAEERRHRHGAMGDRDIVAGSPRHRSDGRQMVAGIGRMAMRTASGSTSPIEGSSCRARRTRSRASGIDGLSLVSKLNIASVGFQCSIRRPAGIVNLRRRGMLHSRWRAARVLEALSVPVALPRNPGTGREEGRLSSVT